MAKPVLHGRDHGFALDVNNKLVGYGSDPITFPDIAFPNPTGANINDIILSSAPDGFWKLNEPSGATAFDSTGNDWHLGINTGFIGPTWAQAAGPPGEQSAQFAHQTGAPRDQLSRVDSPSFPAYASAFTAAIWVRPNDRSVTNDYHYLIGQGNPITSGGSGWQLGIDQGTTTNGTGKLEVYINDASGSSTKRVGNNELPINGSTWYFMAVTRSAAGLWTLFVNGLAQADTGSDAYASQNNIKIGGLNNTADPYQLDGLASYAAAWGRALTSTELLQQYDAGITGGVIADGGTVWSSDGVGSASFERPTLRVTY